MNFGILVMTKHEEFSLKGGKVTTGVVQIGNTVHRPQGLHSAFIHSLLLHLESVHFNGAPRFLGIDDQHREILSYIPGDVPDHLGIWSDNQLKIAATLIRDFHNATAGSDLAGNAEVVCHNDLSPCNTVMQNGIPIALIDFDAAAPGKRINDIAYALWLWCDLGNEEITPMEQSRRISLFCDAYGFSDKKSVIAAIMEMQKKQIIQYQKNIHNGLLEWSNAVTWAKNALQWVENNKDKLKDG